MQKKSKKSKSKKQNNAKKCKWTSPLFPHYFSLFDVPFFPHLFCFRFFSVLKFCFFDVPCVFSFFCICFFKFKNHSNKLWRRTDISFSIFFLCLQPRNDPVFPSLRTSGSFGCWRCRYRHVCIKAIESRLAVGGRGCSGGCSAKPASHAKFKGSVDLQPNYSNFMQFS